MRHINTSDKNYYIAYTVDDLFKPTRQQAFRQAQRFCNLLLDTAEYYFTEGMEEVSSLDDCIFVAIIDNQFYGVVLTVEFHELQQAWINRNNEPKIEQVQSYREIEEAIENDQTVSDWYYKPATLAASHLHHQTQRCFDNILNRSYEFTLNRDYQGLTQFLSQKYHKHQALEDLIPEVWNALSTVLYLCGADTSNGSLI